MTTFTQFLEDKCFDIESDIITKDNYEAVQERWFQRLDTQELIEFGEEYGQLVAYETASDIVNHNTRIALNLHDNLK